MNRYLKHAAVFFVVGLTGLFTGHHYHDGINKVLPHFTNYTLTVIKNTRHTDRPGVIVECMDGSIEPYTNMWKKEVSRRFPNAVLVLCHGADFIRNEWIVKVPNDNHIIMRADDVAQHFKDEYPDRVIVFCSCNTGHLRLNVNDVYYSNSSVWLIPDREQVGAQNLSNLKMDDDPTQPNNQQHTNRSDEDSDVVGSIYEFSKN